MKNFKKFFVIPSFKNFTPTGKAALCTLLFSAVYVICELFSKYFFFKQLGTWEILQLFLMYAVFGLLKKFFSANSPATDFNGEPLPYDNSDESYSVRNKYYKKSAVIYSAVFAVITFVAFLLSLNSNGMLIVFDLILDTEVPSIYASFIFSLFAFAITYFLSYTVEFIWGERFVRFKETTDTVEPNQKDENADE